MANSTSSAATASVLSIPIDLGSQQELRERLWQHAAGGSYQHVITVNPEIIIRSQQEPAFREILEKATLRLPDGAGVVWALKRQGIEQKRLPGIEFAEGLLADCASTGKSVAFIGARPGVVEQASENLQKRMPTLKVAYQHDGFFQSVDKENAIAQEAANSHPAVVLVALGVPRQDYWIRQHQERFTPGTVFIGVGGSFDVWSGQLERAPAWMRRLNLEWTWRLAKEPWRIKRSMPPLMQFTAQVLRG